MATYRVIGPPGTGKSNTIKSYVSRAVTLHGAAAVAVCSLTRAAAAELGARSLPIPRSNLGTLHAIAYRALDHPEIGEDPKHLAIWNATAKPEYHISAGVDASLEAWERDGNAEGDALLSAMNLLRNRRVPRELWPPPVAAFASHWQTWLSDGNLIDFTGLIERALAEVPTLPGIEALMLDEAQDSSALEIALFQQWAAHCQISVAAGDSDQAIFAWRGGDPEAFRGMDVADVRVLAQSYRLPHAVWEWATAWISQCSQREDAPFKPKDAQGEVIHSTISMADADAVAALAEEYTADGGDVMVLATCGYMLEGVLAALRERALPFANRFRRRRGDWNPLFYGGKGVGATARLLALLRPLPEVWGDASRLWTREDIRTWGGAVFANLIDKAALDQQPEDRPLSIEALLDILQGDSKWWPWGTEPALLDAYQKQLLASKKRGMLYPLAVAGTRGARVLRDEPRITIGTVHSVKGGEAKTVILAPDLSMSGGLEWGRPGKSRDGVRRVIYVGSSRASERLILLQPSSPWHVSW